MENQLKNLEAKPAYLPCSIQSAQKMGFNDAELKIWELQYIARPVKFIPEIDLYTLAKTTLLKISIVTGWAMPDSKEFQVVLIDQFVQKLREDYSSLNFPEIEFAVRQFGTKVKDWGKAINLTLIDSVLDSYIFARAAVREVESSNIPPKQIEAKFEPINEDFLIENAKSIFLKTGKVGLILAEVYDLLVKSGQINLTADEKKAIAAQVERRLQNESMNEGPKAQKELAHEKLHFPQNYKKRLANECKKQAAAIYFIKQTQIDNF